MFRAFRLHFATHLKFFVRNRLLLAFAVMLLVMWTLGLIPFFLMQSTGDRFDTLKALESQIRSFAWFYTAALGLFTLWSHTSRGETTLIFTHPGRPEVWLASVFAAAIGVAAVVLVVGAVSTFTLSLVWGVPYQVGFVWLALDGLVECVIAIAILTGLATAIHPVIALMAFAFLNESLLRQLDLLLLSFLASSPGSWLTVSEKIVRGIYIAVPMLDPFSDRTATVAGSLRVSMADWQYLMAASGYAVLVLVGFFVFGDLFLRRRARP